MALNLATQGCDVPNGVTAIAEISLHSDSVKYEVDKDTGAVFVDRYQAEPDKPKF